jgi:hypothetical protein
VADPAGIARLAAQVEALADTVRGERRRLECATAGVDWRSSAATEFAGRAREAGLLLARDIGRLDELAQALRGHAARVESRQEVLAAAARHVEALAAVGIDVVENAAGDAARVAGATGRWIEDHGPW